MSFSEYYNAFGSLGDAYREGAERADLKKYQQDASDLANRQLDVFLAGQGGQPQQPAPLSALGTPQPASRVPSFATVGGEMGDYLSILRGKESGGNVVAKNPNSSAAGIDQFTTGTWAGLARKYPQLGLTPDGRTDLGQSTRAMEAFTRDNANALSKAGVPITPGNLYVSHFLGEAGGPRFVAGVMRNPDAPATNFVDPGAAQANRSIFFNRDGSPKTAGEVYAERTSRFGGAPIAPTRTAEVGPTLPSLAPTPGAMQMPGVIASAPLPPQRPVQAAPGNGAAPIPQGVPAQPTAAEGSDEADMPTPDARPAGFQIPGAQPSPAQPDFVPGTVASPAVQAGRDPQMAPVAGSPGLSPEQAQFLRAQLANPLTRQAAIQTIQGLNAPDKWETKELGGRVVQINGRGDIRPVPGFEKPATLQNVTGPDGNAYTFNPATGQYTRAIEGKEKAFTDLITPEQRAAAGIQPSYTGPAQRGPNGELRLPGKASTEINLNQAAEKAQDVKIGGAYGDTFNELQTGGRAASGQINTLNLMEKLIDTPNFYSGPGSATYLAAQRAAQALGIKDAGAAAPNELFSKLATQSVVDKLGGSLGAGVSNADVTFINRTVSNLENSPEGNRQIIQFGKALAQRQIDVAKLARQYAGAHGGRLDSGFDDQLASWAAAHPLGLEPTPSQRAQQAREAAQAGQGAPAQDPRAGSRPAAQPGPQASPFREGQTATNPNTGAKAVFQGGRWVPVPAPVQGGGVL